MFEINIDGKVKIILFNNIGEKIDFFLDTKNDKLWNEYSIANSGSFIKDRRYSGDKISFQLVIGEFMDVKKD